jgi:hypothetical protein
MKIGLSYSRCIRDIVDKIVDPRDVLVVICRTSFDPHREDQWKDIWEGYRGRGSFNSPREWAHYDADREQEFRDVTLNLWADGKLHQPRKFGSYPQRLPYYWLETVLPDSELESRPAVKEAWERFQILAGLSNISLNTEAH